jgi:hypothetical protein
LNKCEGGALLLAAWASASCEGPAVLTDFADSLVSNADEGYQQDGRLLLEGQFHDLRVEAAPPSYAFALARNREDELWIHSITDGSNCRVANVSDYQPAIWDSLDFEAARLPLQRVEAGIPTLRFANFDCKLSKVAVPNASVVDFFPLPEQRGVLVETDEGQVLAVSPWLDSQTDLGRRVLPLGHPLARNVLVRDGKLTLYDVQAKAFAELGSDVSEAAVLLDSGTVLYVEADGTLHAAELNDGSVTQRILASDVCGLSGQNSVAAYLSPCAEARLNLYRSDGSGPGATFELTDAASAPRVVTRSLTLESNVEREALSVVFFRDVDVAQNRGALWGQSFGQEPYLLAENVLDAWLLPAFDARRSERAVVAFAIVETQTGERQLIAADGENNVVLAEHLLGLAEVQHSLVLLAEGDAGSGDLLILESEPYPGALLRDPELVLSNALAGLDIRRELVLADVLLEGPSASFDSQIHQMELRGERLSLFRTDARFDGALYLTRQSLLDGAFETARELTADAGPEYTFSLNVPDSVLALVGKKASNGYRLKQLWLETDRSVTVQSHVSEFYESTFIGREGLLYATSGDSPALWFSSLR